MADAGAIVQPWFGGARTLAEQMLGLEPALAEARGKTVADFGTAEGAIAIEFAKAGAASVYACDYNEAMIEAAKVELVKTGSLPVEFECADMMDMILAGVSARYDIVLALSLLHKLTDPASGVRFCAESARSLIVVRLPAGSTGKIRGKHSGLRADVPVILSSCGFRRERKEPGPRGEWVQFWRRDGQVRDAP